MGFCVLGDSMGEKVALIVNVAIVIVGVLMTIGAIAWAIDESRNVENRVKKLLIGIYACLAFVVICMFIAEGVSSWWIVTGVKDEYYRHGLWNALFVVVLYLVFYSALIVIARYAKKRYDRWTKDVE